MTRRRSKFTERLLTEQVCRNEEQRIIGTVLIVIHVIVLVFKVPPTHSFVHTLSHTIFTSHLTILTLLSFAFQIWAFIYLPSWAKSPFFLLYFAFWRAGYDAGLGWVLRKQSEKKWIVKQLRKREWLERSSVGGGEIKNPWANWWKKELEAKMGHEGYRWNAVPEEFNAWLMFRQVVDVILLK